MSTARGRRLNAVEVIRCLPRHGDDGSGSSGRLLPQGGVLSEEDRDHGGRSIDLALEQAPLGQRRMLMGFQPAQ
ncbi:hypothetical protein ACFU3E_11075 [Streptomyces sp. NPDC057424]|uniref:hypothetical protein n=1 Tax=Streptomyces sp. NPDC057424 TaxID=3346127 RepID=UPI0036C27789